MRIIRSRIFNTAKYKDGDGSGLSNVMRFNRVQNDYRSLMAKCSCSARSKLYIDVSLLEQSHGLEVTNC